MTIFTLKTPALIFGANFLREQQNILQIRLIQDTCRLGRENEWMHTLPSGNGDKIILFPI